MPADFKEALALAHQLRPLMVGKIYQHFRNSLTYAVLDVVLDVVVSEATGEVLVVYASAERWSRPYREWIEEQDTPCGRVPRFRLVGEMPQTPAAPIPMRLPCPGTVERDGLQVPCGVLHIDEGEFATKPHHTHSCQSCGLTWRPAVVPTVGVRFLPGFKNEMKPFPYAHSEGDKLCHDFAAGGGGANEEIAQLKAEQVGTKRDRDRVILDRNREIDTLKAAQVTTTAKLGYAVAALQRFVMLHAKDGERCYCDDCDTAVAILADADADDSAAGEAYEALIDGAWKIVDEAVDCEEGEAQIIDRQHVERLRDALAQVDARCGQGGGRQLAEANEKNQRMLVLLDVADDTIDAERSAHERTAKTHAATTAKFGQMIVALQLAQRVHKTCALYPRHNDGCDSCRLERLIDAILADADNKAAGEAYAEEQEELRLLRRLESAVLDGDWAIITEFHKEFLARLKAKGERALAKVDARRGRTVEEMRHKRGYQDGLAGLSPTDATTEYTEGYTKGREELARRGQGGGR